MSEQRLHKIESYGNAHAELVAALQRFPRDMWTFKPSPDRWSIHEIVIHIADSEANSYVRCRRFIAEPDTDLMAYDEMRWSRMLHYHDQRTEDAVELFRWLRLQSYHLIRLLPESVWAHTAFHPESGTMTLDAWLDVYERHVRDHVEQMQSNYDAWLAARA